MRVGSETTNLRLDPFILTYGGQSFKMSETLYELALCNVAPRVQGLLIAVPHVSGSGVLVLSSIVTLPDPPFRLSVVTSASRGTGPNEVLTVFPVSAVDTNTNVLTLGDPIESTIDRNYAAGDYAEIRVNASAITDLNAAVTSITPTIVTGIVATGTTQGTAEPLVGNSSIQRVTTVTSGTGVRLPEPTLPASVVVVNSGASTLSVYPASGHSIDGGSANAPISLGTDSAVRLIAASTSEWFSL